MSTTSYLVVSLGVLLGLSGCHESSPNFDFDHDGVVDEDDCAPEDPTVFPGADEVCDGKDNDCDTEVDEGFPDNDGDGIPTCAGDCNDNDPETFPGADELCDGEDNDCDGVVPEDEADLDMDGWMTCEGDCSDTNDLLNLDDTDGDGWTTCNGDCDAGNSSVYPGAPDTCDGILDNDCDGVTDAMEADDDLDGNTDCEGDCDDGDATVLYDGATAPGLGGTTWVTICGGTFQMGSTESL